MVTLHNSALWPVLQACAQPNHPGSGSHGQLCRLCWSSSALHSRRVSEQRKSLSHEQPNRLFVSRFDNQSQDSSLFNVLVSHHWHWLPLREPSLHRTFSYTPPSFDVLPYKITVHSFSQGHRSNQQLKQLCHCSSFFEHFCAVFLHDYIVKLPETSSLHILWGKCRTCSSFTFFFTAAHFKLKGLFFSVFLFLSIPNMWT